MVYRLTTCALTEVRIWFLQTGSRGASLTLPAAEKYSREIRCICTHMHAHTHADTHTCMCRHTHACADIHTHSLTHTLTHTSPFWLSPGLLHLLPRLPFLPITVITALLPSLSHTSTLFDLLCCVSHWQTWSG